MFSMVSHVIRIDQNIIKIKYYIDIKNVRKYVIYEALEDSRSIGETKRYNYLLEWSVADVRHGLSFVTFSNAD